MEDVDMPRPIGPTIPRWQLGEQLARLRDQAKILQPAAAEHLGCSVSKIQKIEAGEVGIVKGELVFLLDAYKVTDPEMRAQLLELQKLGKQRGWWASFGQVPAPFATFLGLESAAATIKVFEPLVVHGLLQTEDYARAVEETCGVDAAEDRVDRQVRIRMERQQQVFAEDPPEMWVILDEAVLRREIGGKRVMAEQLDRLVELSKTMTILVVPFAKGGYPGTLGAMTIFEYADDRHSPVGYAETQAGNLYLERETDYRRCNLVFNHMTAAASDRRESATLITAVARQYAKSAGSTT
jgi:transcriptional regulator with XRE-family HTH domain